MLEDEKTLNGIQQRRMQMALDINSGALNMKKESVATMMGTVTKLESIVKHSKGEHTAFLDILRRFNDQLAEIASFESNHDNAEIEALKVKASALEKSNGDLVERQKYMKHYTAAFNAEVTRKLQMLETAMEREENVIDNQQLEGNIKSNEEMRDGTNMIDGEVAGLQTWESRANDNLIKVVDAEENAIANQEANVGKQDDADMEQASKLVNGMGAWSEDIDTTGIQGEENKFSSKFASTASRIYGLQQGSQSDPTVDAATRNLQNRLNRLGVTSFAQVDANATEDSGRKQALLSLISSLKKENAKLEKLDDNLDEKVSHVKAALHNLESRKSGKSEP